MSRQLALPNVGIGVIGEEHRSNSIGDDSCFSNKSSDLILIYSTPLVLKLSALIITDLINLKKEKMRQETEI